MAWIEPVLGGSSNGRSGNRFELPGAILGRWPAGRPPLLRVRASICTHGYSVGRVMNVEAVQAADGISKAAGQS